MILMCGNTYGTADFCLPTSPNGQPWNVVFDTSGSNRQISEENHYTLEPYSYVLLTSRRPERTKSLERPFLSISKDGHVR
jgi:hypothetical protein